MTQKRNLWGLLALALLLCGASERAHAGYIRGLVGGNSLVIGEQMGDFAVSGGLALGIERMGRLFLAAEVSAIANETPQIAFATATLTPDLKMITGYYEEAFTPVLDFGGSVRLGVPVGGLIPYVHAGGFGTWMRESRYVAREFAQPVTTQNELATAVLSAPIHTRGDSYFYPTVKGGAGVEWRFARSGWSVGVEYTYSYVFLSTWEPPQAAREVGLQFVAPEDYYTHSVFFTTAAYF